MRLLVILALIAITGAGAMTAVATDANAVVCAAGVCRAGCVGPSGAAVVARPPVAACRYVS